MDAFYASVEQRDKPELQGRPVIVGGSPEHRGVVAACSYEARKFGIHSAMPSKRALQLCPTAVVIHPRMPVYRQVSQRIHNIFQLFTKIIEPLSLDEAYLDVTDATFCSGSATRIAEQIKREIKTQTGLTASAGVSFNKFLAKIASDMDKPNGLFVIKPDRAEEFVAGLAIRKFHGIGPATEEKMKSLGIATGQDLRQRTLEELLHFFGKAGHYYYAIARANDPRQVNPDRIRKSLGKEITFIEDLDDILEMTSRLEILSEQVADILHKRNLKARTVTLKVKYADFTLITRSRTESVAFNAYTSICNMVCELLTKTEAKKRKVRLLGVSVSGLIPADEQDEAELEQLALI